MKKFIPCLLSLVLLLTMTACAPAAEDKGSLPEESRTTETAAAPVQTDSREETDEPTGGSMDETMKTQLPGAAWQAKFLLIGFG